MAQINSLSLGNNENKNNSSDDSVLLSLQTVSTTTGDMNCFFDNGSTCCLILFSTAERLDLPGETVLVTLTTVNGEEKMQTLLFLQAQESPEPVYDLSDCGLKSVPAGVFSKCKVLRKEALLLQVIELLRSGEREEGRDSFMGIYSY